MLGIVGGLDLYIDAQLRETFRRQHDPHGIPPGEEEGPTRQRDDKGCAKEHSGHSEAII